MAVLDHRVLVHRQPVVGVHIVEVDQPGDISADAPVLAGDLDRHALDQIPMEPAVLLDEQGGLGLLYLAQYLLQRLGRQVRVEPFECFVEARGQQHLVVADTLGRGAIRGNVRPVQHRVPEPGRAMIERRPRRGFPRISCQGLHRLFGFGEADFSGHELREK